LSPETITALDEAHKHCQALHWLAEKASTSSKSNPKFSACCANGKVVLPPNDNLDPYMIQLLKDNRFMSKIRSYNAAFAFLSFSAKSDINLSKNNIYTYRVQGTIHHRAGPLTQTDDLAPKKFAQIYILDGEQQELQRMNYADDLDILILKKIRLMLEFDCNNPYVLQFKTAASIYKKDPSTDLKISIHTDKSLDR